MDGSTQMNDWVFVVLAVIFVTVIYLGARKSRRRSGAGHDGGTSIDDGGNDCADGGGDGGGGGGD